MEKSVYFITRQTLHNSIIFPKKSILSYNNNYQLLIINY